MDRTERVELAVLCLLTDGDKLLLQNRVKRDWHGCALPGGHVEPGESFVDAVIQSPELTEFQYLVDGEKWTVCLK